MKSVSKYIMDDYNNGIKLLKVSLMNALTAINTKLQTEIKYEYMPWTLLLNCLQELKWDIIDVNTVPSGVYIKVNSGQNVFVCSKSVKGDNLILHQDNNAN